MKRTSLVAVTALTLALAGASWVHAAHPWRIAPPNAAQIGLSDPSAQAWDTLNTQQENLRVAARADFDQGLIDLDQALADSNSNLRTLAESFQQQVDAYLIQARNLRDAKLDLYEQMTPEQQLVLRDTLRQRLARFKRVRAAFLSLTEYPG